MNRSRQATVQTTNRDVQAVHDGLGELIAGQLPDSRGRFGTYGGRFVPETLMPAVLRLEEEAKRALSDPGFLAALDSELATW